MAALATAINDAGAGRVAAAGPAGAAVPGRRAFGAAGCAPPASLLAAGQTLFQEGDDTEDYFELLDGAVRLFRMTAEGRRVIVDFVLPGQRFGLNWGRRRLVGAEAILPSTLRQRRRSHLRSILGGDPELAGKLLAEREEDMDRWLDRSMRLLWKSTKQRLAWFLLDLGRRSGQLETAPARISLAMPRADIAEFLAMSTETVSRALAELRNDRLIRVPEPRTVMLLDLAGLEAVAEQDAAEAW